MKVIEEIGFKRTFKFFIYSLVSVLYHVLIDHLFNLPPARHLFLRILGAKIGKNSVIMSIKFFNWHHQGPSALTVGDECFIGDETLIDLYESVIIKDQVTIAQRVTILTHLNVGYQNHPLQKYFPKTAKPVVFEKGCVIGACSTILPGLTIGRQSFVAAGSVVTKNVPAQTLVGGVPAKIIRKMR